MPELSIVIPALGNLQALESGLVSVLENRPSHCELLVVLNVPYDDPYKLADEVRFVQAPRGAGLVESLNLGIQHSRAELVHMLAPGAEVSDGWTQPALAHFQDAQVAAVAPLVLDPRDRHRVVAAGVTYGCGGVPGVQTACDEQQTSPLPVLGPTSLAAFYRKSALVALGGFDDSVGDQWTAVDLALQLRARNWQAVCEPGSQVFAEGLNPRPSPGFQQGREIERLFLRHAPQAGWGKSLCCHPLAVLAESCRSLPSLGAFTQLAGRLAAWGERSHKGRQAGPQLPGPTTLKPTRERGSALRVDVSHTAFTAEPPASLELRATRLG